MYTHLSYHLSITENKQATGFSAAWRRECAILLPLLLLPLVFLAQTRQVSLNGTWQFALDPLKVGLAQGWNLPAFPDRTLDKVQVPHCFSADDRYHEHTGTAWYFKEFEQPVLQAEGAVFLHFEAVFYKAAVWLNGEYVGAHEGGYTPFEWNITRFLKPGKNLLSVQVNNEWDTTTIPGAKTVDSFYRANASQLYAWMNYGGITRPVSLVVRPAIYIGQLRVTADPDLQKQTARVRAQISVQNLGGRAVSENIRGALYYKGQPLPNGLRRAAIDIPANGEESMVLEWTLPAGEAHLWDTDFPNLYELRIEAGADSTATLFGIRKLEVAGGKLLLNGTPVRMAGANRPTDHPGLGSVDPDTLIGRDLALMKSAGMEFSRIAHHAVTPYLLDWADRHGMLIITEAGNWQMTPKQMADTAMRRKYRQQAAEMIRRDWNHPSVIAYSLGNEFLSHTPEGIDWVKDMKAFVRGIDSSRLITFASYIVWRDYIRKPEEEASFYVDFISANIYANHEKCLEHIAAVYPGKPVYVSEFGRQAKPGNPETERISYLSGALQAFRRFDNLAGASVWSFNDYRSRYPGTESDGYRWWGLVTPGRTPRAMYYACQQEFAPAILTAQKEANGRMLVRVTARSNFPCRPLKAYSVRAGSTTIGLKTLAPGEAQELHMDLAAGPQKIELVQPGGLTILSITIKP